MLASALASIRRVTPGLGLCVGITALALAIDAAEAHAFGRAWLEALILAIVLGAGLRTSWRPPAAAEPGIDFAAKTVLEIAVVLLGLSVSATALVAAGPKLLIGIALIVALAIAASYAIGRGFGLSHKLAMLIACGNSICGNTAIVAVAPVIEADGEDIGASIAFTAALGVLVVLALPPLAAALGLTQMQSGIFAGLTIYSVSQVVAAAAPMGALSVQIGTLVKLARMLMLGPIVLALSLAAGRGAGQDAENARRFSLSMLAPWFVLGFLAMIGLRATGLVPAALLADAACLANLLIVMAMAALGLCVDIRAVTRAGARVTAVVCLSHLVLGAISLAMIHVLGA